MSRFYIFILRRCEITYFDCIITFSVLSHTPVLISNEDFVKIIWYSDLTLSFKQIVITNAKKHRRLTYS